MTVLAGAVTAQTTRPSVDVASARKSTLNLTEIRTLLVPDTFNVIAGTGSSDSAFVVWSPKQPYVLLWSATGLTEVPTNGSSGIVGASFVDSDSIIEIVTAVPPQIVRLTNTGVVLLRRRLGSWSDSLLLESAARLDTGWFIGGVAKDRSYHVVYVANGTERVVSRVPADRGRPASFYITRLNDRVVMSSRLGPYGVTALSPDGRSRVLVPKSDVVSSGVLGSSDTSSYWVALPLAQLDTGFVQTFADLKSDRRILARFDSEFRSAAHVIADVPVAFMASIPRRRVLLAARNVGTVELVLYEWSWTSR